MAVDGVYVALLRNVQGQQDKDKVGAFSCLTRYYVLQQYTPYFSESLSSCAFLQTDAIRRGQFHAHCCFVCTDGGYDLCHRSV